MNLSESDRGRRCSIGCRCRGGRVSSRCGATIEIKRLFAGCNQQDCRAAGFSVSHGPLRLARTSRLTSCSPTITRSSTATARPAHHGPGTPGEGLLLAACPGYGASSPGTTGHRTRVDREFRPPSAGCGYWDGMLCLTWWWMPSLLTRDSARGHPTSPIRCCGHWRPASIEEVAALDAAGLGAGCLHDTGVCASRRADLRRGRDPRLGRRATRRSDARLASERRGLSRHPRERRDSSASTPDASPLAAAGAWCCASSPHRSRFSAPSGSRACGSYATNRSPTTRGASAQSTPPSRRSSTAVWRRARWATAARASRACRWTIVPGRPQPARARLAEPGGPALPGVDAAGWIKRGPTGVIGTHKKCAHETVDTRLRTSLPGGSPSPSTRRNTVHRAARRAHAAARRLRGLGAHRRTRARRPEGAGPPACGHHQPRRTACLRPPHSQRDLTHTTTGSRSRTFLRAVESWTRSAGHPSAAGEA